MDDMCTIQKTGTTWSVPQLFAAHPGRVRLTAALGEMVGGWLEPARDHRVLFFMTPTATEPSTMAVLAVIHLLYLPVLLCLRYLASVC